MVLFTLNNFTKDDGGTVRMRGILNALAQRNIEITLLSNAQNYTVFDDKINHIYLDCMIDKNQKRYIQTLLSISPKIFYSFIFKSLLSKITPKVQGYREIIFFEYLDNSIGYLLKSQRAIERYINDIHGIAPLEFKYKKRTLLNSIKLKLVQRLDKKVIEEAFGFWFVTQAMRDYFEYHYPSIKSKYSYIIKDGISSDIYRQKVNKNLLKELKESYRSKSKKVLLFIGDFKDLGGVLDLIEAFNILIQKDIKDIILLLVGDGEMFDPSQELVQKYQLEESVVFLGRIAYDNIRTYQELSDIIICPDKNHLFSQLVPHIKYFDALISGKVVINGGFKSIKDININQRYSIDFIPSNIEDLASKIEYALSLKKQNIDRELLYQNLSYSKSLEDYIC